MAAQEPPRLSSAARSRGYDVAAAARGRAATLARAALGSGGGGGGTTCAAGGGRAGRGGAPALMARLVGPDAYASDSRMRAAYAAYVAALVDLADDGEAFVGEALAELADTLYEPLCAHRPRAPTPAEVKAAIGHGADAAAVVAAAKAAVKLKAWATNAAKRAGWDAEARAPAVAADTDAAVAAAAAGSLQEFGMALPFETPSAASDGGGGGAWWFTGLGARSLGGGAASAQAFAAGGDALGAALEAAADEQAVEAARLGTLGGGSVGADGAGSSAGPIGSSGSGVGSSGDGTYGLRWLVTVCSAARSLGGASAFGSDEEVAAALCRALLSGVSDDEAAAAVFDLLGEGALEAITELLAHRGDVSRAAASAAVEVGGNDGAGEQRTFGTHGTGVSVQTERAKAAAKARRKEAKRAARRGLAAGTAQVELLLAEPGGFEMLLAAETSLAGARAAAVQATGAGSAMRDDRLAIGSVDTADWMRSALPKGTTRTVYAEKSPKYEEVRVPAAPTASSLPDEEFVPISTLPRWAQLAFKGYESLNRIQSRIYPTGFGSNENLLVCAPTGAGKTNIAMITVLREIGRHVVEAEDGSGATVDLDDFKIVYVAPMKALAAEMAAAFQRRLEPLGLYVRELTGDMSLTKRELEETQMIITTPEKWDVITRKPTDQALAGLVRLLIIDEVHLLADERGAVIEALVSRTLRQVEVSQSMIRIVGLSATLPNYRDVATFLGVNHDTGLFHFGPGYRPIPLEQQYIGVMEKNIHKQKADMNAIAYTKVVEALRNDKQAMIFVHSRKETAKTARALLEMAQVNGDIELFDPDARDHPQCALYKKDLGKSRNGEMSELALRGFGVHHAGMLRPDRTLSERLFAAGFTRVLCCTATLAWGVNLPAHTVVIKGTSLYAPDKGGFVDLGMLDVQQIFGRAGRPQFDTSGEGIIITTQDKLPHYLQMMAHASPIESAFIDGMVDNLNAEVVLGTVTNVSEAVRWLGYSYLHVRMRSNPLHYGMRWEDAQDDPGLTSRRRELVCEAARQLDRARMVRYDSRSGNLYQTEQGRVASHFYIRAATIERFNEILKPHMSEGEVLDMIAQSTEFEQVAVREEEMVELERLAASNAVPHSLRSGGVCTRTGKVNCLIQAYVSRSRLSSFSLTSDGNYVASNLERILRALFELALRRGSPGLAYTTLCLATAAQRRVWPHQLPLRQMDVLLKEDTLYKLEQHTRSMERLLECDEGELGEIVRHPSQGAHVRKVLDSFPALALEVTASPLTRTVLQVKLSIWPEFVWNERVHGNSLRWHIWVEDQNSEHIYHSEMFTLTKKETRAVACPHVIAFTIPMFEPLPPQYYVRALSDEWLCSETTAELSLRDLVLPEARPAHTELLALRPLPRSALQWPAAEALYERKFTHFNAVQTQAFHTLYHTDKSVLMGAPTGSGKTVTAELAIMRAFRAHPKNSVVYIAPLKSLVRERVSDWGRSFCPALGRSLVELTGDHAPDLRALLRADLIVTTPEKWDGVSRAWANRAYVRRVALLVIDEVHLLGADRGPVLEAIVSRMRHVAGRTGAAVRVVGLSTALANAHDLADWLGIERVRKGSAECSDLFNFRPSVRPIPMEVHIQGFPGRFYCPRMATMNKPCYSAICQHSPLKPALIFVASRRQTRLTALDLIAHAAADESPKQFLRMSEADLAPLLERVHDSSLRHTLQFGIGLHHAGLKESDRTLVERLFAECKVQVLVSTSTLAWGVNLPAHLVIVKGTEFYDGASRKYVDFPITDVLQMMGRAGRPQFDTRGVAVIMVHEPKKSFYKRFLYEPFPVESSLHESLTDHLNAEIVAGTVHSPQDAVDYLTWTYLFRRLAKNPTYYGLQGTTSSDINDYLSGLVEDSLTALEESGCVEIDDDAMQVEATALGKVASLCYLQHRTAGIFAERMRGGMSVEDTLECLCAAAEFDELPVRHNEDVLNLDLAKQCPVRVNLNTVDEPHTKAHLLVQAHLSRIPLPVSDYITDTKTVLDSTQRLLVAMVDIAAQAGWLDTTLSLLQLSRGLVQARWPADPPAAMLPGVSVRAARELARGSGGGAGGKARRGKAKDNGGGAQMGALSLHELAALPEADARAALRRVAGRRGNGDGEEGAATGGLGRAMRMLEALPALSVRCALDDGSDGGDKTRREVCVSIERASRAGRPGNSARRGGKTAKAGRAVAPMWPKAVEEGWHAVLCDGANGLLAIRRVPPVRAGAATTVRLSFDRPPGDARPLRVWLVSSAYMGLDSAHDVEGAARVGDGAPGEEMDPFASADDGDGGDYDDYDDYGDYGDYDDYGGGAGSKFAPDCET